MPPGPVFTLNQARGDALRSRAPDVGSEALDAVLALS